MIIIKKTSLSLKYASLVMSLAALALTGCGQKNELYLVDPSTQTVTTSSDALASTSNPQDVAFANIDDSIDNSEYQRLRDSESPMFPEVSDDPNDY